MTSAPLLKGQSGLALTLVMVILMLLAATGGYVINLSYNQKRFLDSTSGNRIKAYYWAQAGIVNANTRIGENYTGGLLGGGGTNFNEPSYDPAPYALDMDGDGVNDVTVDIGTKDASTGLRPIVATGRGT